MSQLEVGTGDSSAYLPATEPLFHTELPASTMFPIICHRQVMGHPDTPDCSLLTWAVPLRRHPAQHLAIHICSHTHTPANQGPLSPSWHCTDGNSSAPSIRLVHIFMGTQRCQGKLSLATSVEYTKLSQNSVQIKPLGHVYQQILNLRWSVIKTIY